MANFLSCIPFVLKHEGGDYSNPVTGEVVNFGITKDLLIRIKYIIQDPKLLTVEQAQAIYQQYFWTPLNLDQVTSNLVAQKILDMNVNMQFGEATKLTQASLNSLGFPSVVDGILGPHTMIELNTCIATEVAGVAGEMRLLDELRIKSIGYYKAIPDPGNAIAGWLARANDIGVNV